jgi:flagellar biosynthesis/type III secretory pathway M-ring protein FliF/YscJ
MEFIRKNLAQIQEQLKNLSLSNKLLFLMIFVVIIFSFFWMVYLAATPETVPLLDQPLADTMLAGIQNQLEQRGAYHEIKGGRIMVKRQDRNVLLAQLQMDRALPADMSETWRKWIQETDMWLPQEDRQNRWQLAKEERLGQIIQCMDGVQQARVIINAGSKQYLAEGPSSNPSASVSITMQSGVKPPKRLITAVADFVSSAVDRLARDRVSIVVDGASFRAPGEDSSFSSDALDIRQANERYYSEKILQVLGIERALVGVFVDLNTEAVQTETREYTGDPVPLRESSKKRSSDQKNPSGEPGTRPNTGLAVTPPDAGGEKSSDKETDTEYNPERNLTHIIKKNSLGTIKSIRATVNVPSSYFADIYRRQTGKADKPKDTDLAPIVTAQLESIRKKILPLINQTDPAAVEVSQYYDLAPTAEATALASSGSLSVPQLAQYGKPAGLLVLALVSLLMVLMMLKKASGGIGIPSVEGTAVENPEPLEADGGPIGEAAGSEGVLEGIEVDEKTLRSRKMAEQVATMIKEDPAGAANLVRRWIANSR